MFVEDRADVDPTATDANSLLVAGLLLLFNLAVSEASLEPSGPLPSVRSRSA